MKNARTWAKWGGLAAAAAFLVAATGSDGLSPSGTTITVSGVGYDSQATDFLQISAATSVFARRASSAMEENARISERLRSRLRSAGIAKEDFATGQFNFQEGRDPKDRSGDRDDGYIVTHQLQILVRDPDKAGAVMDALVDAGATNLQLAQSRWGGPAPSPEAAGRARREAVGDAMAKARDFAAALNMRVARVVSLNEGGAYITDTPPPAVAPRMDTQITTRQKTVQAGVSMVVELERR